MLSDPSGDQRFAKWNNELIDLGLNNTYYKEDICRFIDRRLDLITEFRDSPDFAGAKLEYFNNGGNVFISHEVFPDVILNVGLVFCQSKVSSVISLRPPINIDLRALN